MRNRLAFYIKGGNIKISAIQVQDKLQAPMLWFLGELYNLPYKKRLCGRLSAGSQVVHFAIDDSD